MITIVIHNSQSIIMITIVIQNYSNGVIVSTS